MQTRDPACGALVDSSTQPPTTRYRDQQYCFCSSECQAAFERNPGAFVPRPARSSPNAAHRPLRVRMLAAYAMVAFVLVVLFPAALGLILGGWPLALACIAGACLAAVVAAVRLGGAPSVRL